VLPNTTRVFWKTITKVDVEHIDVATEVRVAKQQLDKLDPARSPMVAHALVEAHEAGLLFIDGKLTERLPAGRHAFWAVSRTAEIQKVDTRPTPLEVTAQEILTKDRVGIRVTHRIVDPEKAALAAGDVANTIYRLVQFAIREAVAMRTLDEILAARDTIDRETVTERAGNLGVEIGGIGVKGRKSAGRRSRAAQQGRGSGAHGQGQPDPAPGGDGGNAVSAQHGTADGGQPSAAAPEGAGGAGEVGREGRPH
jgi:hypothetical protein